MMEIFTFAYLYMLILTVLYSGLGYSEEVATRASLSDTNEKNPVQCSPSHCNISSTYGIWPDRMPCRAQRVVYPRTQEELLAAVATAVQKKQKMKVVSRRAHSIPKLICPGGRNGLVISTRDYNRHLVIDKQKMRVEVDSGMELWQLIAGIAEAGLALPYTPYWDGISIGGLLSTGAHGSSFFQKGGAVHEYVVGMTLVVPATAEQGFARVIELTEDDEELLNAAKVSLGVLGVISKVKLQLEPLFKRSITNEVLDDADMEERILEFAFANEFGDVVWHPSEKTAVYKKDNRVSANVLGDGVNDFVGFRGIDVLVVEATRALETSFEATDDAEGKCVTARLQVATLLALANGLKNNDNDLTFTGYPVIGYQHQLQASGSCKARHEDHINNGFHHRALQKISSFFGGASDTTPCRVCPWDSSVKGEFFHQTTISIGISKVQAFFRDVKALRDLEHKGFCGMDLYYGVYLRFVKASSAFLGEQEDSVNIDITYYRPREDGRPRLLEDVIEEVEQMAAFKYAGRPHWGKNRPVAFSRVWEKYTNLNRFLAVKDQFDPDGLFSSEWTDALLGIANDPSSSTDANPWPTLLPSYSHDGCALEGLCICSVDAHCAPLLGYFCQPGKIYHEARVCRKMPSTSILEHVTDNFVHDVREYLSEGSKLTCAKNELLNLQINVCPAI